MQKLRGFSLRIVGLAAVALLVGTSAFAESRHLGRTPRLSHAPRFSSRIAPRFGRAVPFRGPAYSNSGRHFVGRGRIDRIVPYYGGYHVFLGGWGDPFFVPYRYWDPYRFRIGLFIGTNAFYDPLGYDSVYGWPRTPYYSYRGDSYHADNVVSGVIQTVDLHTGYVTLDDDVSHRTITALLPPRDSRVDNIRVGDYVEFSGEWTRRYFDAARMDRFEPRH